MFRAFLGHFGNMDQAVVVEADVYEGAEVCDISDGPLEAGAHFHIRKVGDGLAGHGAREALAGIAAGAHQGVQDVMDRGNAGGEFFRQFLLVNQWTLHRQKLQGFFISQILFGHVETSEDFLRQVVGFGMDGRIVQGLLAFADAEEPGALGVGRRA